MGGRDKGNTIFSCGAFCKAKYEFWRWRKRGRGGHSFSPHPFFCLPRPSELVLGARSAPSVPFKKGSRIFKQRAPDRTSRFFGSQSDSLLAAPRGAARKELGGKIIRRDEIPRNNFFGNEAVRSNFLRKISRFAGLRRRFFIPSPNISHAKI